MNNNNSGQQQMPINALFVALNAYQRILYSSSPTPIGDVFCASPKNEGATVKAKQFTVVVYSFQKH